MDNAEQAGAPEDGAGKKKDGKRKAAAAALALLLAASLAALAWVAWSATHPAPDSGATVSTYEGMTKEEIQAELDRKTSESRMTMSVAAICRLEDGKARVNVVNVEGNRFAQSFELSQGGKTIYSSGVVQPGESVEWCDADGAEPGDATVTIQARDKDTGKATGAAQSVQVTLVEASD